MHFLSIVPTLLLAALTFGSTSQQTPVEGLEHRQLPSPPDVPKALTLEVQFLKLEELSLADAVSIAAGVVSTHPSFPTYLSRLF